MVITDPSLKPGDRYLMILNDRLSKDGFSLKARKFEKLFEFGKLVINPSFISQGGFIYCVDFYCHIIFETAEKIFQKLFGKHWTNWTVHNQVGQISKYFCDESTRIYTDTTLNDAAALFFKEIFPKIELLDLRFKSYEQLNAEYNQFPAKTIDIVPSNRFERRILMGLLLTKLIEPSKYHERKKEYLERFNQYQSYDRDEQEQIINSGINILGALDMNAANKWFPASVKTEKYVSSGSLPSFDSSRRNVAHH